MFVFLCACIFNYLDYLVNEALSLISAGLDAHRSFLFLLNSGSMELQIQSPTFKISSEKAFNPIFY